MDIQKCVPIDYNKVEECVTFLKSLNVFIDDVQLFDQLQNLKKFISIQDDTYFFEKSPNKFLLFFSANQNITTFSKILKIAQFFFAIPGHNASTERVFSLITSQWTKERNRFLLENVKGVVMVQFNFKHFKCADFFKYLKDQKNNYILKEISSSDKYGSNSK